MARLFASDDCCKCALLMKFTRMAVPEIDRTDGTTAEQSAEDEVFARSIQQARNGNAAALNELIATWRTYLLYVANSEIQPHLRQKLGASDLVQSACLDIHRRFADFRGETIDEWRVWLRRLLMHDLQDARRRFLDADKRDISRERSLDDRSHPTIDLPSNDKSPRSELIAREEWESMQFALQRLSDEHREVLRLRNWDQLPFAEIGSLMGRSEDATQKLWTRALNRLQAELDNASTGDSRG